MSLIPSWIPLLNLALLCWLVCWSIITERRMWYLKSTMERAITSELSRLREQVTANCDDLSQMRCTIRDTIAKVDALMTMRGGDTEPHTKGLAG